MKTIYIIFGIRGLIGTHLANKLHESNAHIIGVSRNVTKTITKLPFLNEVYSLDNLNSEEFKNNKNKFIFINLSGEPLTGLWTKSKKHRVLESRKYGVNKAIEFIKKYNLMNCVILSASGIGIYKKHPNNTITEQSSDIGNSFISTMSNKLEKNLKENSSKSTKIINLRFGIVLSKKGGSLTYLKLIYNFFIGGKIDKGNQWWSWIHIDDVINSIIHIIDKNIEGSINITSPNPEKQKDFSKTLGKIMKSPYFMITPSILLKPVLGEFISEIKDSRKVHPQLLLKSGYDFKYDKLEKALKNILK